MTSLRVLASLAILALKAYRRLVRELDLTGMSGIMP